MPAKTAKTGTEGAGVNRKVSRVLGVTIRLSKPAVDFQPLPGWELYQLDCCIAPAETFRSSLSMHVKQCQPQISFVKA